MGETKDFFRTCEMKCLFGEYRWMVTGPSCNVLMKSRAPNRPAKNCERGRVNFERRQFASCHFDTLILCGRRTGKAPGGRDDLLALLGVWWKNKWRRLELMRLCCLNLFP